MNRILLLTCIWLFSPLLATAADSYEKFYGDYVGETVDTSSGTEVKRNLGVTISPAKKGFNVSWETTTIKADGRVKSKSYSINFIASDRDNIFSSAMKTNLFGGQQALDPMKGDPYVWARINGDTLSLHALVINDDGGFEMQTYDRTLIDEGMKLVFSRYGEGHVLKHIEAILTRQ